MSGYKRCYESHPALKIKVDSREYLIYGGSCGYPVVKDADVYVGFDMSMRSTSQCFPWEKGEEFLYYIQDMSVPQDAASFKKLIKYLADSLTSGKKVHIGCIGGHGRTGLVLSALVTYMTGELDSISYVRKNYCEKAVESKVQVEFLHQHFGIVKVPGAKEVSRGGSHSGAKGWPFDFTPTSSPKGSGHSGANLKAPKGKPATISKSASATPVKASTSIWGGDVKFDKLSNSANM